MFRLTVLLFIAFGVIASVFGSGSYISWTSVALDSTGKYLTASSDKSANSLGQIYVSNDYGASWNYKNATASWQGVASDSTGQKLVAVNQCTGAGACGAPHVSTDRGETWNIAPDVYYDNYYQVSSSTNGVYLVASAGGNVYGSGNSGAGWGRYDLDNGYCGTPVAKSGNGQVTLISYREYINLAAGGTSNFKQLKGLPSAEWRGLATDYTGEVISGAYDKSYEPGGTMESGWYVSTDGGATMKALIVNDNGEKFYSVSVNSDGTHVFCGASQGTYVYNTDTQTVTKSDAPINGYISMASSKTGQYVLAGAPTSLMFSSDYGLTFKSVA